jgi:hypothetical protein
MFAASSIRKAENRSICKFAEAHPECQGASSGLKLDGKRMDLAGVNPDSEVGNEIEKPCREPIVGRARHSVRAAPATSECKISPASPSRQLRSSG